MNNNELLGSVIQLIYDIKRISFLDHKKDCDDIYFMTRDWIKRLESLKNKQEINSEI